MSTIDLYRRTVERKRDELVSLQKEKAKAASDAADALKKENAATASASKSKSVATVKSKLREAERYSKKYSDSQSRISAIEKKITSKQKELDDALAKVTKEEENISKKRIRDEERQLVENERRLKNITQEIATHEQRQNKLEQEVWEMKQVPDSIAVLFFATNPKDTGRLRLDEEARNIRETISKSKHRDSVNFETRWAVRPMDLIQAINEVKPTVLHFSGHGAPSGDLALEDDLGNARLITPAAITQAITTISDTVRFAFFDACDSASQAESVVKYIEGAIGMITEIGDAAAIAFASQFYSSIGFGLSVQKSFDQAKAILMMEFPDEADTPQLFIKDNMDADKMIIVNPGER